MFTDAVRGKAWENVRQRNLRAFADLLTPELLARAAWESREAWAGHPLNYATLAWLAIACALNCKSTFQEVLEWTFKVQRLQPGFSDSDLGRAARAGQASDARRSPHDPRRDDPTHLTEEAFTQARQRMPREFWDTLFVLLVDEFEIRHAPRTRFAGLRLLSLDATDILLPNYAAVGAYFGRAKNAQGFQRPQARLVLLQLTQVRLPLHYLLTPLSQGEITSARKLTTRLRRDDLVLMDAGYWSYGLFQDVAQRGAYFAIRKTTRKFRWRTLRRLSRNEKLVEWTPKDSRGYWRKQGLPPSIQLRVIRYRVPGFRPQDIVTNLLDTERVPYEDWVRLAWECDEDHLLLVGLYHRRWEIETTFNELKVRLGLEGGLRGRTRATLEYEVAGYILCYLLVRWLIVEAAEQAGEADALRLSFPKTLTELAIFRETLLHAEGARISELVSLLLLAMAQHRVPRQPGRWFPRKKKSSNHKRKQNCKSPTRSCHRTSKPSPHRRTCRKA